MTQSYAVSWSKIARQDLFQLIEYLSIKNPASAKKAYQKIKEQALQFDAYPERGRIASELQRQGIAQYRELIVAPWRVIYKIGANRVYVLSVLDSRRNLEDILLQRLLEINHEKPFS